jgi:glycerate kinase
MRVLIAPDKFKGSLTAAQVVRHLDSGLEKRGVAYRGLPLADGGDGSVAAAVEAGYRSHPVTVAAATGEPHTAVLAFDGTTAVVEVANTCGLHTLPEGTLAPLDASSAGVGDALRAAVALGARRIVLALGGSASTDGGAGMLAALGAVFRDDTGHILHATGGTLQRIHAVDTSGLPDLSTTEIIIAGDLQNPLTGLRGAAAVYGPQKGADAEQVRRLDAGLTHLVTRLTAAGHAEADQLAATPGAGAAGGLGFGAMLLGGRAVSGADYFLDLLNFDMHVEGCDLVITGEGRMDDQTLHGKLPAVVAHRAGLVPVIAVVGRSDISEQARAALGIRAVHAVTDHTDGDPAHDPELTAHVLEELGEKIPLPGHRPARLDQAPDAR